MTGKDILIVDDEAAIRDAVAAILEDEGYDVRAAPPTATRRCARSNRRPPGLVLLDIWLEGRALDGVQMLERIKPDLR